MLIVRKNGEIRDYFEINLLDSKYSDESIRPHLTKTFRYHLTGDNKPLRSIIARSDKIDFKILDFKIKDE